MEEQPMDGFAADVSLPLFVAADLQDHVLTVSNDLDRLQTLLDESHQTLQEGFFGALALLQSMDRTAPLDGNKLDHALEHLASAIKAFQFHDMATQLIGHTAHRLHYCADTLARDALACEEDEGVGVVEDLPLRANPVTQSAMDTGFVELF